MELIIAMVLFIALVACWIVLPAEPKSSHAPGKAEASASPVLRA